MSRIGTAYDRLGLYEAEVGVLDQLLALPGADQDAATILNDRCWTRAEWGHRLDLAKADCDAALAKSPRNPSFLDSRGLVELKLGQFEAAAADYGAATSGRPNFADALYGRGVAERALGRNVDAAADFAAAKAVDPQIAATFARYGVTP